MSRPPPDSTLPDTRFPYTTRFRSDLLMIPIQPFAVLWFIYSLAMFFVAMRLLREARPFFVFFFALALYFTRLDTGWMLLDEFAWRFVWFVTRSEEHTSELQSLMRISYAVFCLKTKKKQNKQT